jgi:transposase
LHRAQQRAANARKNYLDHVSKWLRGGYDRIAYEALKVKGLAKGNLAKSIIGQINHRCRVGMLLFQRRYKAESAGRMRSR